MSMLSSSEFMGDNFSGQAVHAGPEVDTPLSYSKSTNTSVGRQTAWRSQSGMSLGKKNLGSTLNWDEGTPQAVPQSDKGASFGGA